ncbi:hypothetical protein BURC_01779 [Burkholderiaceae bacterium]|nr:hypothetical protein BURC_01779 [Burkholderiaceae bacterium]
MLVPAPPPRSIRRRPRTRALVLAAGVAATMHGCLLGGDDARWSAGGEPAPRSLLVRSLEFTPVAAPALARAEPVPLHAMPPPTAAAVVPTKRQVRAEPAVALQAAAPVSPRRSPPAVDAVADAPPSATEVAMEEVVLVAADTPGSVADEPPPLYRTRLPPPVTLHYTMRRGMIPGSGELHWKPAGTHYEVRLEGRVAGMAVLTEVSTGTLDGHGLAPLRFTDARIRRGTNAANFQRDKGKITFSGPQTEYPLLPGSQDRVSWMLQIAAVLNAEPQHAAPGGKVAFFVVGARGDADVWVFRYVGAEKVSTDEGELAAVKFTREPRKPYDRGVEIWLAPARQYLPVRARFTTSANGDEFELLLRDMRSP